MTFDGTGSIGPIATYEWDFGDGTTAPGATVTHTYSESNRYTARLTVVDACADSSALDTQVSIEDAEAAIKAAKARIAKGKVVDAEIVTQK